MTTAPDAATPALSLPFDQAFAIAHFINNLLAVVAGKLDDIHEARSTAAPARDAAAMGLLAAERAARLMRGMMASLSGEIFRPGCCDSDQLLRHVQAMRRAPGLTPVALDGAEAPLALICDPVALSDLIGNTLDSLRAQPGRAIRLGCARLQAFAPHLPAGSFAELSITGALLGDASDWQQRALGEDWRQAVDRFCRAAGGEALFEDGEDIRIRLRLPCLPQARPKQASVPKSRQLNVLVVEDDEPVREHAARVIAGLGYAVTAVPGAEAALEIIGSGTHVDIVFTDVILPDGMSGGELAEHLQRLRPKLPIVFTSGHNADSRVSRMLLHQGATLLPKPYRRSSLAAALASAAESSLDSAEGRDE